MKVYLDVCCLGRPFDDQRQDRIHLEAEAVLLILSRLEAGEWEWIGSEVALTEVGRTPDTGRRLRLSQVAGRAHQVVTISPLEVARAVELQGLGFHAFDALHLACAERAGADVFLTTDDRLLRRALRLAAELRVRVANPLSWLQEVSGP